MGFNFCIIKMTKNIIKISKLLMGQTLDLYFIIMIGDGIQFLHYKNAVYTGNIDNGRRNGQGLIFLDSSCIILGSFRFDQLDKNSIVWISYDTYFIGQLKMGVIDGSFVLRSPNYVVYSSMTGNIISSDILVINKSKKVAKLWSIENNQVYCSAQIKLTGNQSQGNIIKQLAPYIQVLPNSQDFILSSFSASMNIKINKKQMTLQTKGLQNRKITLKIENDEIVSCGMTEDGKLQGLGVLRERSIYYEGQFHNGTLNGQGIKQDMKSNKIIYGVFEEGDIRTVISMNQSHETVIRHLQILKRRTHVHALQFINTYVTERPVNLIKDIYLFVSEQEQHLAQQSHKSKMQIDSKINKKQKLLNSRMDRLADNLEQYNFINNALKQRR